MNPSLTAERVRELLDYDPDTGVFRWKVSKGGRAAGAIAGSPRRQYWQIGLEGGLFVAHRLAWLIVTGAWPCKFIDHINGDGQDNRFCNLREATPLINSQNRRQASRRSKTGYLGVVQHPVTKHYEAYITYSLRTRCVGVYQTPEEAHAAYVAAKRKLHEGCTL